MAKKFADKNTKELFDESAIKEKGLDKSDFTSTWQGRLFIIDPKKSLIAKKVGIDKSAEYAIKVR